MGRLDGRTAVIVGAGQSRGETLGNGRATAITFANEGARLLLVDRDEAQLAATTEAIEAASGRVASIVVDIATDDGPQQVVDAAI